MSDYTQPCGMWVRLGTRRDCEQPATVGFASEVSGIIIPICDECIGITGMQRKHLTPLTASARPPAKADPRDEAGTL